MLSVILFRHGKSNWNAKYDEDYDRPLAERGISASKKMGIFIAERHEIPDLVISSPAIRTQDTAKLAIEAGGWDTVTTLTLSDYLYLASKHTIISLLSKQKEIYSSICIVGHEPSMSSFINNQTNQKNIKYPTCTMAMINFDIDYWSEIKKRKGTLMWLKRPKKEIETY